MVNLLLEIIWRYLAGPVFADAMGQSQAVWKGITASTGYNPVNTVAWAAVALLVLAGVREVVERKDIDFGAGTVIYASPFVLLGGTLRFVEDAALMPFQARLFLVTPVIYFLMASIFVASFAAASRFEKRDRALAAIGTLLLIPVLVLAFASVGFPGTGLMLAAGGAAVATGFFHVAASETWLDRREFDLAVFSQLFGGAVSAYAVTQGYQQKQLLAQLSTEVVGPAGIVFVKAAIAGAGLYILKDTEDRFTETIIILALVAVGLGTGFRVFLRTSAGI